MGTGPITPNEVEAKKLEVIPDFVFEAFNEVIAKNFRGSEALVKQEEAMESLLRHIPYEDKSRGMIFMNHWLDIEDAYRVAGWVVKYDAPGYNESYEAYFTFRRPHGVQFS